MACAHACLSKAADKAAAGCEQQHQQAASKQHQQLQAARTGCRQHRLRASSSRLRAGAAPGCNQQQQRQAASEAAAGYSRQHMQAASNSTSMLRASSRSWLWGSTGCWQAAADCMFKQRQTASRQQQQQAANKTAADCKQAADRLQTAASADCRHVASAGCKQTASAVCKQAAVRP